MKRGYKRIRLSKTSSFWHLFNSLNTAYHLERFYLSFSFRQSRSLQKFNRNSGAGLFYFDFERPFVLASAGQNILGFFLVYLGFYPYYFDQRFNFSKLLGNVGKNGWALDFLALLSFLYHPHFGFDQKRTLAKTVKFYDFGRRFVGFLRFSSATRFRLVCR